MAKDRPAEPVDMSPEAVRRRLEEMAQLYELWLSLKKARFVGPGDPPPAPAGAGGS
jgi:hypothetical protein